MLPSYQRRTARVDEAILGVYLGGTNSQRLKGALAPLLRGGPLSKEAVSRLVRWFKSDFEEWSQRDLSQEALRYLWWITAALASGSKPNLHRRILSVSTLTVKTAKPYSADFSPRVEAARVQPRLAGAPAAPWRVFLAERRVSPPSWRSPG